MKMELKEFFKKIKTTNQSFLFYGLYYTPEKILGNKDIDAAEKEYYELHNYYDLILNYDLVRFLDIALKDNEFYARLDIQTCRKLGFFLYDSIEFKKYHKYQEELLKLFHKEMTVKDYLEKTGISKMSIIDITALYEKYNHLFEYQYSKEQVDSYDEQEAERVRRSLNFKIEMIIEETIKKHKEKEYVLKRIIEDDYLGDCDNIYLANHLLINHFNTAFGTSEYIDYNLCDSLVCNNNFLDIIQQLLEKEEITGAPLNNVIEIIGFSIKIKTNTLPDAVFFIKRLGNNLVNEFDIKKAEQLQSALSLYKHKKGQFSKSKIINIKGYKKK